MKSENQEVAAAIINQIAESPKANGLIGVFVAFLGGISADEVAVFLGIALTLICIYNQLVTAKINTIELKSKSNQTHDKD